MDPFEDRVARLKEHLVLPTSEEHLKAAERATDCAPFELPVFAIPRHFGAQQVTVRGDELPGGEVPSTRLRSDCGDSAVRPNISTAPRPPRDGSPPSTGEAKANP